jgi:prepilin-type N-terminal cleavage/methylation domain-containing protein
MTGGFTLVELLVVIGIGGSNEVNFELTSK